ncbi:30S ribosomal protein S2 [Patescibacteria group bacterium]|nr:30S ribosomal protein S2 [Patescibacteria group bacterium]
MKIPQLPTLKQMLEAGVHFGHKKQYSDARGRDNFHSIRDKVVIIDLEKTLSSLEKALKFLAQTAENGATVLFVGTKTQVRNLVKQAAEEVGMPHVTNRWLGGTLTNFETIEQNLKKLTRLEEELNNPQVVKTKKEKTVLQRTIERAKFNLGGVSTLKKLPQVLFVVDPVEEKLAIKEATTIGIPVVALLDTNANPRDIDFPIPANDDAPKALEMMISLVKETIKDNYKAPVVEEKPTLAKEK